MIQETQEQKIYEFDGISESKELEELMSLHWGSETFTRHHLFTLEDGVVFVWTEGITDLIKKFGCYWLVDGIAYMVKEEYKKIQDGTLNDLFNVIVLEAKDNVGILYAKHDTYEEHRYKLNLPFVDMKDGIYEFYLIGTNYGDFIQYTLLLTSEY